MSQFRSKLLPFCADGTSDPNASTTYPFQVNLEKLVHWYWHVKTIRIDVSLYLVNVDSGDEISISGYDDVGANNYNDAFANTPPVTERDLICSKCTFQTFECPTTVVVPGSGPVDPTSHVDMRLFKPELSLFARYLTTGPGVFSPRFNLSIQNGGLFGVSSEDTGGLVLLPDITCSFFGEPFFVYALSSGMTGTESGTITISAPPTLGYWPYAPSTGGAAVIDTTTGVLIPPNVVVN